ncbi:unnamed protein product [Trichogramma brassicae]|uniref:Carboxylic ester hydrolase n=1 Tax=Trichogramma brassicae TaxID=86971 RepID=A0A6H5IPE3_9HYME|nr:unnamed protein product [Trichogramma brassicae]
MLLKKYQFFFIFVFLFVLAPLFNFHQIVEFLGVSSLLFCMIIIASSSTTAFPKAIWRSLPDLDRSIFSMIVDTLSGKLRGSKETCKDSEDGRFYYSFKGIPYAEPPTGQLRFRDPVAVKPWKGVRDALAHGANCPQSDFITSSIGGSDDCLYLNVYTSAKSIGEGDGFESPPQRLRPTMVWIHGGGFMFGSGDDTLYGPDYFMTKDIVLVTINYRLGALGIHTDFYKRIILFSHIIVYYIVKIGTGFLNLEDELAPGNQGLKDQVLALKWIRDNIASFGGDPENVTIFGESAGGASVHYLSISPMAKGLFHKVISQSGVIFNPWARMPANSARKCVYKLCDKLGISTRDHKEIIDQLRSVDCLDIVRAQEQVLTPEEKASFLFPFGPGTDALSPEPFMARDPVELAAAQGVQLPLLLGHNTREGILFLRYCHNMDTFNGDLKKYLHPHAVELMKSYDLSSDDLKQVYFEDSRISQANRDKFLDLIGDLYFNEGIQRLAKVQVRVSSAPTYLYRFSYDSDVSALKAMLGALDIGGTSHGDELQKLFRARLMDTMLAGGLVKGSQAYKVMQRMIEMWVNFSATGRPTPEPSELVPIYWQPVNDGDVLRYMDIGSGLRMKVDLNLEQRFLSRRICQPKL